MRPVQALGCGAVVALLAVSPAGPAYAQRIVGERPDPTTVEGGMWSEADKAELAAKASGELERDSALNAYVRDIACKVTADYCSEIRVYVMNRPFFNAGMASNGYMEVWSGLLLRTTNEAELAFALGHESGHFLQNHGIKSHQALKSRANAAMVLQLGLAIAASAAAYNSPNSASSISDGAGALNDVVYLAVVGSYFAFSRDQEREADQIGFEHALAAGYSPAAPAQLWRDLLDETQASDFEKVRKQPTRTNVFGSHPLESERVAALEGYAKDRPATGDLGRERYRAAIRPHLGRWLRDDLRRKDFGETLVIIGRLASTGDDLGVLNFYRGEAYRLRRKDGDLALARAAYQAAAEHEDAPVEVWRQLGDIANASGDKPAARVAYQAYLEKAPQAQDRWLVEAGLKKLTEGAGT